MARATVHNEDIAKILWGKAANTACHIVNIVYFRPRTKKQKQKQKKTKTKTKKTKNKKKKNTPYELWKGRKPKFKYFKIFGNTCFILKDRENVRKFDTHSDEGIFLGYLSSSKAYRIFNKTTSKVMEIVNVVIDETLTFTTQKEVVQLLKFALPSTLVSDKVEEDSPPTSMPHITQSFDSNHVENTPEPTTLPPTVGHMEREPSSIIRLNHPREAIVRNINELNLRKRTIDK